MKLTSKTFTDNDRIKRAVSSRSKLSMQSINQSMVVHWLLQHQMLDKHSKMIKRRRTIVPGGPDHAVGRFNCQTWPQICRIQFSHELHRRSETGPSRLLVHVHGTNFHHRFVAFLLLLLLNVNLRHFYTITLLIQIVRRPCCVSALTSP